MNDYPLCLLMLNTSMQMVLCIVPGLAPAAQVLAPKPSPKSHHSSALIFVKACDGLIDYPPGMHT